MKYLDAELGDEISLEDWVERDCRLKITEMTDFQKFLLSGGRLDQVEDEILFFKASSYTSFAQVIIINTLFSAAEDNPTKRELYINFHDSSYIVVRSKYCACIDSLFNDSIYSDHQFQDFTLYEIGNISKDLLDKVMEIGPNFYFKGRRP